MLNAAGFFYSRSRPFLDLSHQLCGHVTVGAGGFIDVKNLIARFSKVY